MLLTARKMAFAGLTLAVSFCLLMLGSVLEMSTLFFLAAAAMCIGIVIRELGVKAGAAFLAASLMLGFFLAPNKLYVLTYGAMESYILLRELLWEKVFAGRERKQSGVPTADGAATRFRRKYFFLKWAVYQPLFLPFLLFAPQLFYGGEISVPVFLGMLLGGEVLWFVCDAAYDVFQSRIWARIRRQFDWKK